MDTLLANAGTDLGGGADVATGVEAEVEVEVEVVGTEVGAGTEGAGRVAADELHAPRVTTNADSAPHRRRPRRTLS